jgi:hypothetical protein
MRFNGLSWFSMGFNGKKIGESIMATVVGKSPINWEMWFTMIDCENATRTTTAYGLEVG